MTIENEKKHECCKNGFSLMAAAKIGAIVGAGVVIAAVFALKKKKNREMVRKVLTSAKEKTIGFIEVVQKQVEEKESEIAEKMEAGKEKIEKVVESVKNSFDNDSREE